MYRGSLMLSAFLCTLFAGATLATAQVRFTQNGMTSGDTASNSIVSGDFNNDGILDLVTVNTSTLSFYKGLGGAKYAAAVEQALPVNLSQALAADFNRDGKLDLAIGNNFGASQGGVTIMLGNGDGTFTQGTSIKTNGIANYIALADFNGDRMADVAVSACLNTSCSTQVYLSQGNGTFKLSATLSYGGGQIVAGDFNADGHQDLAVIANNEVVMYLGNGNGTFQNPILGSLNNASGLAVGDFYNNRIQSLALLVVINQGPGSEDVYIYSGRYSGGQFLIENQKLLELGVQAPYNFVVGGDLNGDFKDDVFLVGGTFMSGPQSAYMLGNGDGTFGTLTTVSGYGAGQSFPIVRDLDLDSRHDLGIAWINWDNNDGGAEVMRNTNATTNCTPPKGNTLSVHICAPTSGQTVGKTFTFKGAGNAWNGYAKRMELWIDHKKVGQNLEDQLNVTTNLSKGSHTASFVVVDTYDNYVSQSVTFTSSY